MFSNNSGKELVLVGMLLAVFVFSDMVSALDCTDLGSDGVADGIITVATNAAQSNCYTNGIDDNIEINYALSNASLISGSVHVLPGLYIIGSKTEYADDGDGTIYIKSNTKFYGDGAGTIIRLKDWANWGKVANCVGTHNRQDVTVSTGYPLFGINESFAHNIEIYNLTFDGNLANQCEGMDYGGAYYNTIRIRHVTNLSIHDNYFYPTLNDHIRGADGAWGWPPAGGRGVTNVRLFNNVLIKANHAGIGLLSATNSIIYGNEVVTGANAAIRLAFGSQNVTIENNTIHGGLDTYGIELTCSGNNIFENNTIKGNTVYAQGFEGIVLFTEYAMTSGTCNGTIIIGNIVYQNAFKANAGIGVHDANNTLIEGNTIYNNKGNGIDLGIYSGYVHSSKPRIVTVRNNIVTDSTGYGISNNDPNMTVIESYNLYYNNTLGASYGVTLGTGTITGQDPLFVNVTGRRYGSWPYNGPIEYISDFHLKGNQTWNKTTSSWDAYGVNSPAIGAGDPTSDNSRSLWGGIVEMGAYGNTPEASANGPDTLPPTIISTDPANNTANIRIAKTISITFNENVQSGTNYGLITLKDASNNILITTNTIAGNILTLDSISDLSYSTGYTISIPSGAIKDISNNNLANLYAFSFTTSAQPVLTLVVITPNSTSIANGSTQAFGAEAYDQFGNIYAEANVAWSSSDTTVGMISPTTGLSTTFTAKDQGTTTITASSAGKNGTATITVTAQASGLVAYWNFNEGTGTNAYDSSGIGNNGFLNNMNAGIDNGSSGWTANGKIGKAIMFDGVNDYVSAGSSQTLNITTKMSFSLWLKPNIWNNYNMLFDKSGNGATGWRILNNYGSIQFTLRQGYSTLGQASVSNSFLPVNQWHQLSGVWDGTNISLYLDGILKNSNAGTSPTSTTGNLMIGRDNGASQFYFNGTIDEVKIYNSALLASEILAEYNAGSAPQPSCSDSIQNQGETGVDCGGPCASCSIPTLLYINVKALKDTYTLGEFLNLAE